MTVHAGRYVLEVEEIPAHDHGWRYHQFAPSMPCGCTSPAFLTHRTSGNLLVPYTCNLRLPGGQDYFADGVEHAEVLRDLLFVRSAVGAPTYGAFHAVVACQYGHKYTLSVVCQPIMRTVLGLV